MPSQADVAVFKAISPDSIFPAVARWYTHIKSYEAEFGGLPGSSEAGQAFLGGSSAAPAAPAKEAEDDDDVDLFGSDDEEDAEAEKLKAERVAAYNAKKAAKPKAVAKVRQIPAFQIPFPFACRVWCPSMSCIYNFPLECDIDSLRIVGCHLRCEALGR